MRFHQTVRLRWTGFSILVCFYCQATALRAQTPTFISVCPNSAKVFLTGAEGRKFDKSWQWDYPILIYDMRAVRERLDLSIAQRAHEKAKLALSQLPTDEDLIHDEQDADSKVKAAKRALSDAQLSDSLFIAAKKAHDNAVTYLSQDAKNPNLISAEEHSHKALQAVTNALGGSPQKIAEATAEGPALGKLYWREVGPQHDNLSVLNNPGFVSPVYTTEKILVLLCNGHFGDGASESSTEVAVNNDDFAGGTQSLSLERLPLDSLDRLYVLDPSKVKENSLQRVEIKVNAGSTSKIDDTVATAVLARHKVKHFSAGGGLLVTNGPARAYTVVTVPTTVTTATATTTTVITNGATTSSTTSNSSIIAPGTASYVLAQRQSSQQFSATAGVTWYPFGIDTFPVSHGSGRLKGFTGTYDTWGWRQIGLFLGTSVSSFGTFTAMPAYEIYPGLQVAAGVAWRSKTILPQGIVACTGYGTSAPSTTSSTNSTSSTTTASGTTTVNSTTVVTNVTTTSGCTNGDRATLASGTSAPTQSTTKPAFSFGILFNTNLLSKFTGFGK